MKWGLSFKEQRILAEGYHNTKASVFAEMFGVKKKTIYYYARKIGLEKTPEFRKQCASEGAKATYRIKKNKK